MELSVTKLILILVIVLVLFGRGKIPGLMSDIGKGIRSLKEGLKGDEKKPEEPKQIVSDDKENKN